MSFAVTTLRFGRRRVLVAHPNEYQYGHLGLGIMMALVRAREADADVYFIRPSTRLGGGLFELESPDVQVLRPAPVVRQLLRACISWWKLLDRVDVWREGARERVELQFVREVNRYVADLGVPPQVRDGLRRVRRRLRASLRQAARDRSQRQTYLERRRLRERVPVRLRRAASEEAAAQARAHGIPPDARLVCIHAREAGYKLGTEIQDRKPHIGRDDQARNARIVCA